MIWKCNECGHMIAAKSAKVAIFRHSKFHNCGDILGTKKKKKSSDFGQLKGIDRREK